MASENKVVLSGKIYNLKANNFGKGTLSTFGLSVWNGKDKATGKNDYQFINCKYWNMLEAESGEYVITGKLAFDTWSKDGKNNVRPYILVDSVVKSEGGFEQPTKKEIKQEFEEDSIPF